VTRDDPVTPELAKYVLKRDGWCVVAILVESGAIAEVGPCRDRWGHLRERGSVSRWPFATNVLTIAHVRDRAGGRMAKRPPSIARRLVAVCAGHHLADPIIDRPDVRDAVDDYLASIEGPDLDDSRPWERVRRVRARGVDCADRNTREGKA
jgi:hypothetical protein